MRSASRSCDGDGRRLAVPDEREPRDFGVNRFAVATQEAHLQRLGRASLDRASFFLVFGVDDVEQARADHVFRFFVAEVSGKCRVHEHEAPLVKDEDRVGQVLDERPHARFAALHFSGRDVALVIDQRHRDHLSDARDEVLLLVGPRAWFADRLVANDADDRSAQPHRRVEDRFHTVRLEVLCSELRPFRDSKRILRDVDAVLLEGLEVQREIARAHFEPVRPRAAPPFAHGVAHDGRRIVTERPIAHACERERLGGRVEHALEAPHEVVVHLHLRERHERRLMREVLLGAFGLCLFGAPLIGCVARDAGDAEQIPERRDVRELRRREDALFALHALARFVVDRLAARHCQLVVANDVATRALAENLEVGLPDDLLG